MENGASTKALDDERRRLKKAVSDAQFEFDKVQQRLERTRQAGLEKYNEAQKLLVSFKERAQEYRKLFGLGEDRIAIRIAELEAESRKRMDELMDDMKPYSEELGSLLRPLEAARKDLAAFEELEKMVAKPA